MLRLVVLVESREFSIHMCIIFSPCQLDFTSSTFSFNLPSPPKATSKVTTYHNNLHLNYLRTSMLMFTSKSSKLCDVLHSSSNR